MSRIHRNIFWLLVSQVATWCATLATLVIVPNKLGSTDLGTYAFASGYVLFFTLIASLGTATYISRAVARDHNLLGPYVWNAVLLKVVLWVLLSAVAMGLAYLLGNRGQTLTIIGICCLGMLPTLLAEVFAGGLAGIQDMARPAVWSAAGVYFHTVAGILVLLLGGGVVAYAAVTTFASVVPFVANWLLVRRHLDGHRSIDPKVWRLLVVGGIPLLALTFLNMIYGSVDVPILHSMVGSEPVGWYGVALKWAGIPVFATTAVVAAYFPAFSQHGKPIDEHFAPLVNRAIYLVLMVSIPACVGLFFVADDLIHLIYSDGYDQAIVLVQILAVGIPIMGMDTVLGTALVASDRVRRYLWVAASAAVLNPTLCFILIRVTDQRYSNGAIGAAIITVATELWVMLGALRLRSPGVMARPDVIHLARILAASAVMIPVLLIATDLPLFAQIGLGGIAYGLAALLFKVISVAEIRELISRFTNRNGGEGDIGATVEDDLSEEVEVGLAPLPPSNEVPPFP
jgi:O-antigen/teichoic acid export membrane protein